MSKATVSKRNRHTGKINAFVRNILSNGTSFKDARGTKYKRLWLGNYTKNNRYTIVRASTTDEG